MSKNDMDSYLFHQGTNYTSYNYMGCNLQDTADGFVYSFRVWAPNAFAVSLVSDFTSWDAPIPLNKITDNGIWELIYRSDVSLEKNLYKFQITSSKGVICKGDPYARFSKGKDDGASIIYHSEFKWNDVNWLKSRKKKIITTDSITSINVPINIYEVHAGSFARKDNNDFLTYRELADTLVPYVKAMGYTHVEFLPIMEYPFEPSWGYQVCGFYAPTSRFGEPNDFKYLIDKCHTNGIGVILDWVPAHFPKDEWGLYEFDGQSLYEYQGSDRIESRTWGTRFFDLGREEVQSFLISNALYYLREFHVDGLRVDAVASMLYLDYDREPGEWSKNVYGTNINLEAEAFLKKLNSIIHENHTDVLMIAEESASHGKVTHHIKDGGLGFSMKWNMGWANDFYDYILTDPYFRKYKHQALNFPIMYAFSENYCLPISHDEVVHGKKSFIDKMFGKYEDKFSQMRASLLLMMTYPGKKLMFMGTEYGQFREWDYDNSLEWFMLDYPLHNQMRDYVRALNDFYLSNDELWSQDFSSLGFEWILPDENDKNTVVYRRINTKNERLIVAINLSGEKQCVEFDIPKEDTTQCVFASDESEYNAIESKNLDSTHVKLILPRFYGLILKEKDCDIKLFIQGDSRNVL